MPLPPRGVLKTLSSDAGHVVALYNPLIIACFSRKAEVEELAVIEKAASDGLAEGITGGLLYVVARKEISGGIDPNARATFERMTRNNSSKTGANAVVIQLDGFGGALIRGFLAGLVRLMSQRQKLQVCASVEQACQWLAPQHDLDPFALRRACREAMAPVGARVGASAPP